MAHDGMSTLQYDLPELMLMLTSESVYFDLIGRSNSRAYKLGENKIDSNAYENYQRRSIMNHTKR